MRDVVADEDELQALLDQHAEDEYENEVQHFPGGIGGHLAELWQWDHRDAALCGSLRIQERRKVDGGIEQRNRWRPDEGEPGPWTPWYPAEDVGSIRRGA